MTRSSRLSAGVIQAASIVLGSISLILFFGYPRGLFRIMPAGWPLASVLGWDALLSVLFFVQHSIMIRRRVRTRCAHIVPPPYQMSVYSIVSAVFLVPVTLLWQRSPIIAFALPGAAIWAARGLLILVFLAFIWGMLSLKPFDPFGVVPLAAFVRGRRLPPQPFRVRGAYRWVRHPLYFCMIALLWLNPRPTLDAVFGNALWTVWILAGTILEERDLVVDFGDAYRRYRRTVPMLIPRGPAPRI